MRRTSGVLIMRPCPTVRLVQLLGAIGSFEFMTLARNAEHANSHHQEREKFHCAASITSRHRNATPKGIEIQLADGPLAPAARLPSHGVRLPVSVPVTAMLPALQKATTAAEATRSVATLLRAVELVTLPELAEIPLEPFEVAVQFVTLPLSA